MTSKSPDSTAVSFRDLGLPEPILTTLGGLGRRRSRPR
jgi:hypothetical protein